MPEVNLDEVPRKTREVFEKAVAAVDFRRVFRFLGRLGGTGPRLPRCDGIAQAATGVGLTERPLWRRR